MPFPLTRQPNFSILAHPSAGGWSNGKTADSDSAYRGSNPCPPAKNSRRALSQILYGLAFCFPLLPKFVSFVLPCPYMHATSGYMRAASLSVAYGQYGVSSRRVVFCIEEASLGADRPSGGKMPGRPFSEKGAPGRSRLPVVNAGVAVKSIVQTAAGHIQLSGIVRLFRAV